MAVAPQLEAVLRSIQGPLTLGELAHRMGGASFGLTLVVTAAPFLQPVPLLGVSSVLGPFLAVLSAQVLAGRDELWLPGFLARRRLGERAALRMVRAALKLCGFVERWTRPRLQGLARRHSPIGGGVLLCAVLLTLPVPVPFSNTTCAVSIVLFGLALLEEDGLMALLGFIGCVGAIAYHAGIFWLGLEGMQRLLGHLAVVGG